MKSSAATAESRQLEVDGGSGKALEEESGFASAVVRSVLAELLLASSDHVLLLARDGRITEANEGFAGRVTRRWSERPTLFQETLDAASRSRFVADLEGESLGAEPLELAHATRGTTCTMVYSFRDCPQGWVAVGREPVAARATAVQQKDDGSSSPANLSDFDKALEAQKTIHARDGSLFSVICIDLDNFRQVNSLYGHVAGDEVLERVGMILVDNVREEDLVARTGGEEFSVILPGLDACGAMDVGERLRNAVEKAKMPQGVSRTTISLGVAAARAVDCGEPESRAESALRLAKERGRNCICCVD